MVETVKKWIGALTEVGLLLLALAIVAALLVGANLPFFGDVVTNIMALVKSPGDAGAAKPNWTLTLSFRVAASECRVGV